MITLRLLFIRHGHKDDGGMLNEISESVFGEDREAAALADLLYRLGAKEDVKNDSKKPLSAYGRKDARALAVSLRELDAWPEVVLTSLFLHARNTAQCLSDDHPIRCDTLLPLDGIPLSLAALIADVPDKRDREERTVAVVGHENRLSQLVAAATGERIRPLDQADVVCVATDGWAELRRGQGRIEWRYPVRTHETEALRPKLSSKMTVATFLAGFTFTALLQTVTSQNFPSIVGTFRNASCWREFLSAWLPWSWLPIAASTSLVIALVLFVVTVYIYDRLSMPAGFWNIDKAGSSKLRPAWRPEIIDRDGLVYLHMVHTWSRVFSPAVFFAAVGLLLIAWWKASWVLALSFAVIGVLAIAACAKAWPRLGVD